MTENLYEMTLSMNVLNHLGINLYSSNPAVLSEAVANAWDADASSVDISLDVKNGRIIVQDTGVGMTREQINKRFLKVGYERRKEEGQAFTKSGRPVMGRKGIGKLALFSIARMVLVETIRDGEKNALLMNLDAINDSIGGEDPAKAKPYYPRVMPTDTIDFDRGTRITLSELKQGIVKTAPFLRKRLARRFSVIELESGFTVSIDSVPVTVEDRDLRPLMQYTWLYGEPDAQDKLESSSPKHVRVERRPGLVGKTDQISGWIGTAVDTAKLKDGDTGENYNRLPLMIRGKLAQEDILDSFNEVGLFRSYLAGEIHADFLDDDDDEDIATSSRQSIREDDGRYQALLVVIGQEIRRIKLQWTKLRNEDGAEKALDIPEIRDWYKTLGKDTKKKAERLFGKINQLGLDADDRNELFGQGVLAFEIMRQKDNLDALEEVDASDLASLAKVLNTSSDLEAAMYHQIVKSRLEVINKLDRLVGNNDKELFLQQHLFEHLWLLDPGWERASSPSMEVPLKKAFAEVTKKLSKAENDSRYDIKYRKSSGQHVIVELKRASIVTDTDKLSAQIKKYRSALLTWLEQTGRSNEPIAIICVVGQPLSDWKGPRGKESSIDQMRGINTRVIHYEELLSNARESYDEYLTKTSEIGRVQSILAALAKAAS